MHKYIYLRYTRVFRQREKATLGFSVACQTDELEIRLYR